MIAFLELTPLKDGEPIPQRSFNLAHIIEIGPANPRGSIVVASNGKQMIVSEGYEEIKKMISLAVCQHVLGRLP